MGATSSLTLAGGEPCAAQYVRLEAITFLLVSYVTGTRIGPCNREVTGDGVQELDAGGAYGLLQARPAGHPRAGTRGVTVQDKYEAPSLPLGSDCALQAVRHLDSIPLSYQV